LVPEPEPEPLLPLPDERLFPLLWFDTPTPTPTPTAMTAMMPMTEPSIYRRQVTKCGREREGKTYDPHAPTRVRVLFLPTGKGVIITVCEILSRARAGSGIYTPEGRV